MIEGSFYSASTRLFSPWLAHSSSCLRQICDALLLTWLGLCWNPVGAAEHTRLADHRNLIFDRLGTQEGLSQAAVSAIAQDQDGFIWVGSQEGLNRFDGYHFETYYHRPADPASLSHDSIWDLLSDTQGNLWVGTDAGLNRYNATNNEFESVALDPPSGAASGEDRGAIHVLFEDSSGRIWIGTSAGLVSMNAERQMVHYHHDPLDPESLSAGSVRAVFEDSVGKIWVGTELGGLNRFDEVKQNFAHYRSDPDDPVSISDNYIRAIIEVEPGQLWLATFNGGVSILDTQTGTAERLPISEFKRARSLLKDQDGDVWVGTDSGLHLWNKKIRRFGRYVTDPTDMHSISDNTVFELFQDHGGVIWVGTFNGISKWNARTETFPHFLKSASRDIDLSSNAITSFAESTQGDIWIGTFEGLSKWDKQTQQFMNFSHLPLGPHNQLVMSLKFYEDVLWVGTMSGGVTLIKDDVVVGSYAHDPEDLSSISADAISQIYVDSHEQLWLTTYGGGVNRYLGAGKFRRYPGADLKASVAFDSRALGIIEGPGGVMWIATDGGGVMLLDPDSGKVQSLTHQPEDPGSLTSNNVISLLAVDGSIMVGTRDRGMNLYHVETGQFTGYTKAEGLASDAVYGMLADQQGKIWVSGGKGLSVLDPITGEFTLYDAHHGLQSDDFNSGAYLQLEDGSFLFGGSHGFNAFDPARISGNAYVPPVRITQFSKFNVAQSFGEPITRMTEIELAYDDSVIGFEFRAMDFTAPSKNQFSYMLAGFDQAWVNVKGMRQVTYTNLDAGEYTFKVKGSNNDGVWNPTPTLLKLTVLPPIWATWWAYAVYLVLVLGGLYQLQVANARRLRREAELRYSARLQLYIESLDLASDCVLIADADKKLMYANHATARILGVAPEDAVGKSISKLLFTASDDVRKSTEGLHSEGRWHGEVNSRSGLLVVTTDVTIAAVRDARDNVTAYVCIARDVTQRKRTESELADHRRNLEVLVADRTQALEREIAETMLVQRELANSLREKELLLKELHHRVKNNMQVISSLLSIQAETTGNEQLAELLGESQQRIKSMALIHENLYQSEDLLEIDFDDYIRMLAGSLRHLYEVPGVAVSLDIRVTNVSLDIDSAVPCGLIINELISNSLKHGFVGRQGIGTIVVKFSQVEGRYVLHIRDDGIGLPAGFDVHAALTMGMEIVSILTQQLDGEITFESNGGARFEVSFPQKLKHHDV